MRIVKSSEEIREISLIFYERERKVALYAAEYKTAKKYGAQCRDGATVC